MRYVGIVALVFFGMLGLLLPVAAEDADEVGSDPGQLAPEISASTWLNTEEGESPFDGDADHRLVMLEFWGTWCGPCVRSMPKVQRLWDRYRSHGLLVVAITREVPGDVRQFLKDNAYTMPVACDSSEACISQFTIGGWPSTFLIDRDGLIVWRGAPYGAEPEIEKALGLESSPKTLLTQCLHAQAAKDKETLRPTLERLVAKAPAAFDLVDWAGAALGELPPAVEEAKSWKSKAAVKQLDKVRKAWKDEAKRKILLEELATGEAEAVDLRAWVRAWYVKAFPFKTAELKELLAQKRYDTILDMFLLRRPSGSLYKFASKDDGFVRFCNKKQKDAFVFARKGIMGLTYWMSDEPPPEGFDSEAFSRDLSISGVAMDNDRKHITGIMIGGETVMKDAMPAWIDRQLGRAFLMDAISAGQAPKGNKLEKKVEKEKERILKALRRKYG